MVMVLALSHLYDRMLCAFRLWQWRKQRNIKAHQRTFNTLYDSINGFHISQTARADRDCPSLVYGEIEFEPFMALLSCCKIDATTQFYDLGSGTGKAVIATALVYPLQRAVGIEILEPLHRCAVQQKNTLAMQPKSVETASKVHFICENFLNCSLQSADVVYINATAYIGDLWIDITRYLQQLKMGSQCICISKKLHSKHFTLVYTTKLAMSWGVVFAYIYEKKTIRPTKNANNSPVRF